MRILACAEAKAAGTGLARTVALMDVVAGDVAPERFGKGHRVMLVLSRKSNEKVVIPSINTVLQIVSIKAGTVRLGIDAPRDVEVFREEVLGQYTREEGEDAAGKELARLLSRLLHRINNRLNGTSIGLALLRRQLDLGMTGEMTATLDKVEHELGGLKQTLDSLTQQPTPAPRAPACRGRALIVEDDANECELMAGFLRLAGLEVTTAGDGSDALDHLRKNARPDVVVLDMFLPRYDGPSTVRAIRENPDHRGLKIIGVTGADPTCFDLPQGPDGIDRWFRKPLNPERLLAEVAANLARAPA